MLQEKAMLVNLSVSQWTASKKDNSVSKAIQAQHGASEKKAGWFNKRLIDPTALEPMSKLEGAIRSYHYGLTLPWGDNGDRILPARVYMEYVDGMRDLRARFEAAVEDFVRFYPQLVQDARVMLGTMYEPGDYPDVGQIAHRFGVNLGFAPVPSAADFRVDIGDEAVEEIKKSITAGVAARQASAVKECWERLHEVISRLVDRLGDPDAVFRDSLIENGRVLCDLLPKLNITDDPNLEIVRKLTLGLLIDPGDIRKSKKLRKQVADDAAFVLEQMKPWHSPTK